MRSRRLLLTLVVVVGAAACSDDAGETVGAGSRDAFCTELRAAIEADLTVFDPMQPASTEDTRAAMARLAEAAPAAVSDEVHLLSATFTAVTEVLDDVDADEPEAADRIEALAIDQDAVAAAQQTVSAYALDECRIDLAAINAASVSTPPTSTTAVTATTTVTPTTLPPVSG